LALTLEEAVTLIVERAAKGPSKKFGRTRKAAKPKPENEPEKKAKALPKKKSAKRNSAPAAGK
jgi:topoisomerase IA-like protein